MLGTKAIKKKMKMRFVSAFSDFYIRSRRYPVYLGHRITVMESPQMRSQKWVRIIVVDKLTQAI